MIEIINLLKKDYALKLFFSVDGSDFMTPERLDQMVVDTVLEHGKIQLGELHTHLLVD